MPRPIPSTVIRYPRGAEWCRWDLHVHTPDSIVHSYPGQDPWDAFLAGLEALPPDIKVIGVNDYIFIDGYRKVRDHKAKGRLKNIEAVLPVLEFRLSLFGGTDGKLSRVNFHVIFSDELDPDVIEQQFINALRGAYALVPSRPTEQSRPTWSGVLTKHSIADLGRQIIESVPEAKRPDFGSPLVEGFNNLALPIEMVRKALESPYFARKHLTAMGKTEWADVKWNDHSIASKKDVINSVDFVFISAETPSACLHARDSLTKSGVNDRLLDCSDAHCLADHPSKDRLGKCFTWIKATPTFAGLMQARRQAASRIVIGDAPPALQLLEQQAPRYMSSIAFTRTTAAKPDHKWFDGEVILNSGLVAVIGNKGSGKSALADVAALLGESTAQAHYSFLKKDKFLEPKGKLGSMFEAVLNWKAGPSGRKTLDHQRIATAVERVKYIPQHFLEAICTDLRLQTESEFDRELHDVIFSHVDSAHRLGKATLRDLLGYVTKAKQDHLDSLIPQLHAVHAEIASMEDRSMEEYRLQIEGRLAIQLGLLAAHDAAKPVALSEPTADPVTQAATQAITSQIATMVAEADVLERQLDSLRQRKSQAVLQIAAADRLAAQVGNLERLVDRFFNDNADDERVLHVDLRAVVNVRVDRSSIESAREGAVAEERAVADQLNDAIGTSTAARRVAVSASLSTMRQKLDEPHRLYQESLRAIATWAKEREALEGTSAAPDTVKGLQAQLTAIASLPKELGKKRAERDAIVVDIVNAKQGLLAEYRRLYSPVQEFIDKHPISRDHGGLQFVATMTIDAFGDGFLRLIHQGRRGSFSGDAEGRAVVQDLVLASDATTVGGIRAFLGAVQEYLEVDKRENPPRAVRLREQLKQGRTPTEVYDFLYGMSYLGPRYELRWNGKPLDQLSPGERGALLLVFYLLIDKRDTPLIIDQPEENLDNKTITTLLVPAIKYAKERRQLMIVTHNPNLAVVCDADQVIYASIDKTNGNRVEYVSGAIEDRRITEHIVDVLEGTKPAFDQRDSTYEVLETT